MQGLTTPGPRGVQLRRLETLTDVVFGIMLWRLFFLVPRPGAEDGQWDSLGAYLESEAVALLLIAVSLAITVVCWLQHNMLTSHLKLTDGPHSALRACRGDSVGVVVVPLSTVRWLPGGSSRPAGLASEPGPG